MSDVNKLDGTQCSFDPEQFKVKIKSVKYEAIEPKIKSVEYEAIEPKIKSVEYEAIEPKIKSIEFNDSVGAPAGTFPWAIIQVYLNKPVRRSSWNANIYLIPKNDSSGHLIYIQESDTDGSPSPWVPESKDMMACDWVLMDCMLSFDLNVEKGSYQNVELIYGYLADDEFESGGNQGPFGTLTNLKNKTDITKFSYFVWDDEGKGIYIRVSSDNNQEGHQKMVELFDKILSVNVDGVLYHLGSAGEASIVGEGPYEFIGQYNNTDASKLGDLLKQNVGNTLFFCFNWK
ncbi:Thoeris anti-defense Tad2 family protein [Xenorhabdus sp. KK7.4]|uniref:Thoeris anti-defense Tad2 family protein n=1 Tax=Xenorhabdus sp. KK7.4 TaxID=1851572 RepID=UPI000C04EF85|nr:MW1434 family type I TA system toxin [Xenorhabdus sp. KK7.4]PHM51429.1 hypothetical protein Xekk_03737 [Xenorhabdus sp. KK7.4]